MAKTDTKKPSEGGAGKPAGGAKSQAERKPRVGPVRFVKQVQAEGRKVTWATRKETIAATVMVVIMAIVAALFFFVADQIVAWLVRFITQIG